MSVSHNGHNSWTLTIDVVQRNDSGLYMCQINTEPMTSQVSWSYFGHFIVQISWLCVSVAGLSFCWPITGIPCIVAPHFVACRSGNKIRGLKNGSLGCDNMKQVSKRKDTSTRGGKIPKQPQFEISMLKIVDDSFNIGCLINIVEAFTLPNMAPLCSRKDLQFIPYVVADSNRNPDKIAHLSNIHAHHHSQDQDYTAKCNHVQFSLSPKFTANLIKSWQSSSLLHAAAGSISIRKARKIALSDRLYMWRRVMQK